MICLVMWLFVAGGFYGAKSPDRRVISGPIDEGLSWT